MKTPLVLLLATLTLAGCGRAPMLAAPRALQGAHAAESPKEARFYAHADVEAQAPGAFSLQPETQPFLQALAKTAVPARDALVAAIRKDAALSASVAGYGALAWPAQLAVLKRLQALECEVMGFTQPPLVIDESTDGRSAFFDFNPDQPGTGRVILYPRGLAKETDPYAGMLLLLHETRHSYQFQLAFGAQRHRADEGVLAKGFAAAFRAQAKLSGKLGFCDFCSLNNEYEAFQSANYVMGALTKWKVDTSGMGCLSSQFDQQGQPRIDLLALTQQVGPLKLLGAFNAAEKVQYEELTGG